MKRTGFSVFALLLSACVGAPSNPAAPVEMSAATLPPSSVPAPMATETPIEIASATSSLAPSPSPQVNRGTLAITVRWPQRIQVIPDSTEWISVTVYPYDVAPPISRTLTRNASGLVATASFTVPVGTASLLAQAYDASQTLVASGSASVEILANTTVSARITMAAVKP